MTSPSNTPTPLMLPGSVWRGRRWSLRVPTRSVVVCVVLAIATTVLGVVSLSLGDFPLSPAEVWATILGKGSEQGELVVLSLRLPRLLVAIFSGAAFGMSGAIFQSLARNPLGSPDIIGFDSGAAFGAVSVLLLTHGSTREAAVGAVLGGLLTAVLVYLLAWKRGIRTYRLVLVGLGIGFVLIAGIDYLMTRAPIADVQRAEVWLTGSLTGRGWDHVALVGVSLLILVPMAVMLNRRLALLEFGDDMAAGLGIGVQASKLALAVLGVILAAVAVAAVGPVAFVAFVCGPVARRLVRTPHAAVLTAAFVGAFFMVAADLAARHLTTNDLPVGVATAIVGAPYLIWLLTRQFEKGAL